MNPWLDHVKKHWQKVKGKMSYKECLIEAKKTYKPKAKPKAK